MASQPKPTPPSSSTIDHQESTTSQTSNTTTIPSSKALHILHSPDGYYTYLQIPPPVHKPNTPPPPPIDVELVEKKYRRLTLKHHPDRKGGDAETFRLLARAKKVLTNDALRKQYDLLGLDLDDQDDDDAATTGGDKKDDGGDNAEASGGGGGGSGPEGVVAQLASVTLASILQVVVRTVMMCGVSTLITKWRWLVVLIVCFLLFVAIRSKQMAVASGVSGGRREMMVPMLMAGGVAVMHLGRVFEYGMLFWLGESLTISLFLYTSVPPEKASTVVTIVIIVIGGMTLSFIVWGRFWRYAIFLGIEIGLAIIAVLIFPIMEMILEEIMNEKLRKVGEKIRAMEQMRDNN